MKNITIEIASGTIFRAILIVLLFWGLYLSLDLVLILLTSVVIASSIEPGTRLFMRFRIPRVLAVIIIYFLIISAFFGLLYFFIPPLLDDASGLLATLSQYAEAIPSQQATGESFFEQEVVKDLSQNFSFNDTLQNIQTFLANITNNFLLTIGSFFGGFFSFILVVVISFYLSVQESGIENFLRLVTPLKHERYIIGLWKRSQHKIGRWMQGQLLLGLLVGILVYLGLTILGIKSAFALAVFAAVFELIPIFGPILAAIPAVGLGFLDSFTTGLMVIGFYVIIQQFENHLIYPLVVRKVVGVSPIVVILSLIVGAQFAGLLGIILAVPVVTALMEFTNDIQKEKAALQKNVPVA